MSAYDELVRALETDSRNQAEGEFTPDAYHLQRYADEVKRIGAEYEARIAELCDAMNNAAQNVDEVSDDLRRLHGSLECYRDDLLVAVRKDGKEHAA